ncbi:MAG: nucleotidyltransferase family protein [Candidatus Deferrimicrobium sp.]
MSKKEILEALASNREELAAMGVRSLSLFGSYARGQELPGSDIDLLVEFSAPIGLFAFVRLKGFLERILEREVDLVTSDAIKERYRESILKGAVRAA